MQIKINIESYNGHLLFEILERNSYKVGDSIDIAEGISILLEQQELRRGAGSGDLITLVVSLSGQAISTLGLNFLSNWLWEKLTKNKGKVKITTINGADVRFNDKGELERFLADKITIEERG